MPCCHVGPCGPGCDGWVMNPPAAREVMPPMQWIPDNRADEINRLRTEVDMWKTNYERANAMVDEYAKMVQEYKRLLDRVGK